MADIEITDHDAPVWNAAIKVAIAVVDEVGDDLDETLNRLRSLIRPELSVAEMDAAGERLAAMIREIDAKAADLDLQARTITELSNENDRMADALRAIRGCHKAFDPTDAALRTIDDLARIGLGEQTSAEIALTPTSARGE